MEKRQICSTFVKGLRNQIIEGFETLEPVKRFTKTNWDYHPGKGGGEMGLLRGDVYEKAAVNISEVSGETFPGEDGKGPFYATGISLITHMVNPHAPTVHMNIRYIETKDRFWFGGGCDLTPMGFPYDEDTNHFHCVCKEALDSVDPKLYPQFSQNASEYFFLPHRNKERGVGGIFFDHFQTGEDERDLEVWKIVGNRFLDAILPIYKKRVDQPYSEAEKELQYHFRAHYVEFNLIYDRGTKFGLRGGNWEAVSCSLPPLAKW